MNKGLIENKWYIVLDSDELKRGKTTKIKFFGNDIILWRDSNNNVNAVDSRCPHRGANLALGEVVDDNIQCPYHGFLFNGKGEAVLIPSQGKKSTINSSYKTKSYKVRDYENFIFLWYGDDSITQIKWFDNLDNSFSTSTMKVMWNTNYTRAIENQLDVSHLPFVHRTTIGRGGRTLVNGPIAELNGDVLDVWVCNESDNGQQPKKQDEMRKDDCSGRLQFIFPNYWQNIISDKLRIVAAFVPVDDTSTTLYIRIYQKILNVFLLKSIFNYITMRFNGVVLKQDEGVVTSQTPKISDIYNKELLVQADAPIILFRKYMHENSG